MPTARIDTGWTLFESTEETQVNLPEVGFTPFEGVPYGQFDFTTGYLGDFDRDIGVQDTSMADCIVKRLMTAYRPEPESSTIVTIPIEMVALQLRSVSPVGGPFGDQHVYVTLQSARGGPQTLGIMAIDFDGTDSGTFHTTFQIYYDIRIGGLDGTPHAQSAKAFAGRASSWQRDAPAEALMLARVNSMLSEDDAGNFSLAGIHAVASASAGVHSVKISS